MFGRYYRDAYNFACTILHILRQNLGSSGILLVHYLYLHNKILMKEYATKLKHIPFIWVIGGLDFLNTRCGFSW